ncbi:MAG: hypothetical protein GXO06_01240 [Epsilonproteobacteria bacterium]|nr:hypothetical protein [Campylobacterota bacterium]
MNLSELTIPFELPFDVPVGLHSPIVHFAVAIPVVIILLEFINIFFKRRALSVFSLFLTLVVATVMVGAYYSGVADGQEAYDMLINAGKEELKEHKQLGIILVYASLALVVLKLFFMLFRGAVSRVLFLIITFVFIGAIFKQGHDGGELVYEYGANSIALQKAIEANDDLKDEIEELKSECEELRKSKATNVVEKSESNDEIDTQDSSSNNSMEVESSVESGDDSNAS